MSIVHRAATMITIPYTVDVGVAWVWLTVFIHYKKVTLSQWILPRSLDHWQFSSLAVRLTWLEAVFERPQDSSAETYHCQTSSAYDLHYSEPTF